MQRSKYLISQVNPEMIVNFFQVMRKNKYYNKTEIENLLEKNNVLTPSFSKYLFEISTTFSQFGIIEFDENLDSFCLTEFGSKMKKILLKNRCIFFEIYHLLSYYHFDLNDRDYDLLPYKSYQVLCNYLYESEKIDSTKAIADFVDTTIRETFNVEGSFSEVCITRGYAWLRQLEPPVIDSGNNVMHRKPSQHAVFLLNLDFFYKLKRIEYNDPLFLNDQTKLNLSKPLFMSPVNVDDIINDMAILFLDYFSIKYNVTGTYIILKKEVDIVEII